MDEANGGEVVERLGDLDGDRLTPVWNELDVAAVVTHASQNEVLVQVDGVVDTFVDEARRLAELGADNHGAQPDQVLVPDPVSYTHLTLPTIYSV